MKLKDLVVQARTCRRFQGDQAVSFSALQEFIDHARLSASARNKQQLRFVCITDKEACSAMNAFVVMGGALSAEQRATPKQHPAAFIAIIGPEEMDSFAVMDVGIAAQTINLAACEAGLACCMIGAFQKEKAARLIGLEDGLQIKLILAIGKADEERRIVPPVNGSLTYYRDENDVHCVPKLPLDTLIIKNI